MSTATSSGPAPGISPLAGDARGSNQRQVLKRRLTAARKILAKHLTPSFSATPKNSQRVDQCQNIRDRRSVARSDRLVGTWLRDCERNRFPRFNRRSRLTGVDRQLCIAWRGWNDQASVWKTLVD